MPSIKFNQATREIEMRGSESFIESNFNKIQELLVNSFGVKKMMMVSETKIIQEPVAVVEMKEFQAGLESRVKRPPMRKYIRKEGMPGHERIVVEVAEQKPQSEISIASLREKFGLTESKIGGIIRDAEKLGKIRRVMNGSYSWT
jgi:hypothetical protein